VCTSGSQTPFVGLCVQRPPHCVVVEGTCESSSRVTSLCTPTVGANPAHTHPCGLSTHPLPPPRTRRAQYPLRPGDLHSSSPQPSTSSLPTSSPCPLSFLFTSHTHFARPIATMATPPPGTSTGLAKSPSPIAPTLDTVIVPLRFGISEGVRPDGTCRPRWERCLSVDANE